jgi:monoamine oxidase
MYLSNSATQQPSNRRHDTAHRSTDCCVKSPDVIIIGAGAAGLAAARALSGSRRRICVIEARDRIGGRVLTQHLSDLPLPIELGAEFIHGEAESTLGIVDAAALFAYDVPDDHWWSSGGDWQRIRDFWGQIERLRSQIRTGSDRSFAAFLRSRRSLNGRARRLALGFVEGYHAAHADRISALSLQTSDEETRDPAGNRQFRIANGYDSVIDWLRAGCDPELVEMRLGSVVTRVQWSDGKVVVSYRPGNGKHEQRVRARAAIVTIPIGVWKAAATQEGAIRFDPRLEEKERALARIEVGHVVKIIGRFRERFWDDAEFLAGRIRGEAAEAGISFVHSDDRFMPTWWTSRPVRAPLLTGWAGGHAADALLAEGNDAIVDRAMQSLSAIFRMRRRTLDELLVGTFTHHWQADPWSRGAYSYAAVGGRNAHRLLARPVRSTLFFAGEATSGDQTGTVAGAIESGRRAAGELLRLNR